MKNKDSNSTEKGNKFDWNVIVRLFGFIGVYKPYFYLLCFSIITVSIVSPFTAILTSKAINGPILSRDLDGLFDIIKMMGLVLLTQSVLQFFNTYLSSWIGQNIIKALRVRLFEHISSFKTSYFDKTPVGRLVTRNVSDIETIADVFSQGIAAMLADVLMLLMILVYMFSMNVRLTLVSLATIPFLLYATYVFKEKIKYSFDSVRTAVSNLNTYVNEHLTGMQVVQMFNKQDDVFEKFKGINREHRKAQLSTVKYYSIYFPVAELISAIAIGFLVWFSGRDALIGQLENPGDVVGFIMLISMFFRPLRMIADRFNQLQLGIVSTSRIIKLLDEDHALKEGRTCFTERAQGEIKFQNVGFEYVEGEPVIDNLNLDIKSGETVAVVGATGNGKTTMVNLLNRFYEHTKGRILIDNVKVEDYQLENLRNNIGIVQQDVFLFTDTIFENIVLGDTSISEAAVWDVIELVGASTFIKKLPGELAYKVQERGANLSVGQRQLLSFVRALVHDPCILVLDEATSSVDSSTEELIQQAIDKMMIGRTSIVIAHRLSTVEKADKIVVMDQGELVEMGSHQDLLLKKGAYHNLYQNQFKIQ